MIIMNKKEKALRICSELKKIYPFAECSLKYNKPYELLIATRLSAQCTDARVNIVTEVLFKKYTSIRDFANADIEELESIVRPCGFYRTKAANIKEICEMLIDKFNGTVPDNMDDLLALPGVGRKTANLILGDIYGKPAIVTDTHCIRISGRFGLTDNSDPHKVEKDLVKLIPPDEGSDFCHRLVFFGREVCKAKKPLCEVCTLNDICRYYIDEIKEIDNEN